MKVPFVDLKAQYVEIKEEINSAIQEVLDNTAFIMGENVSGFEQEFAEFCQSKYCIGTSSGTSALHLSLLSLDLKPGDEVITVANTFIATTEVISQVGAKINFADIDPETYTMDPEKIEITDRTKAIVPVHLYGQPADMKPLLELAEEHNLKIVEDCCQAHGAEYNGKKMPVSGLGCFSFYPGKNLGAYGDAGAIVTDDEEIAAKAAMLRNHGRVPREKYRHSAEGYNERMDAIQAAILRVKLGHLDNWTNSRRKVAEFYSKNIDAVETPKEADYAKHVYHLYVIESDERDKLREHLKSKDISSGIHYPIPLNLQPAYKQLNLRKGSFPVSEKAAERILSLPIFAELSKEQAEHVVDSVNEF